MASKGTARVPAGYLEWGTVHTANPDLGTLMHVAQSDTHVYTGTTKGTRWEIRKWSVESMQCAAIPPSYIGLNSVAGLQACKHGGSGRWSAHGGLGATLRKCWPRCPGHLHRCRQLAAGLAQF